MSKIYNNSNKNQIIELFILFLLTTSFTFILNNLLFFNKQILTTSFKFYAICILFISIMLTVYNYFENILISILLIFIFLSLLIFVKIPLITYVFYLTGITTLILNTFKITHNFKNYKGLINAAFISTITFLIIDDSYTGFNMFERLHNGLITEDTLYHVSISSMLKNYNVVSTGLNGLVKTPYHFFSHTLYAGFSELSNTSVFEVYGLATQLFFIPFLIFSTCTLIKIKDIDNFNTPLLWIICSGVLVITPKLFTYWELTNSYFLSESYLISLILFMFATLLLYKEKYNILDIILLIIYTYLISLSKASVGLIFSLLFLSKFLFKFNKTNFLNFIITSIIVFFVIYESAKSVSSNGAISIKPFDFLGGSFLNDYINKIGKFIIKHNYISVKDFFIGLFGFFTFYFFHFILSWLSLIINYKKDNKFKFDLSNIFILSTTLFGIFIVSFFFIPGGSAYYFSNVAFFIALPTIIIYLINFYKFLNNDLKKNVASVSFISIIFVIFSINYLNENHKLKINYKNENQLIDNLIKIRNTTNTNIILNNNYKNLTFNSFDKCQSLPFLYPAISERAWTNVISFENSCIYKYYGYSEYSIDYNLKKINSINIPKGYKIINAWN